MDAGARAVTNSSVLPPRLPRARPQSGIFLWTQPVQAGLSMNRRQVLCSFLAVPPSAILGFRQSTGLDPAGRFTTRDLAAPQEPTAGPTGLRSSPPLASRYDGQVFERLDIQARSGPALIITHRNVTVRHCRIGHDNGYGVLADGARDFSLHDCEIEHTGAPPIGPARNPNCINLALNRCAGTRIFRLRAGRGSSNIYAINSPYLTISTVELHDARGPEPRGQNLQFDKCPSALLEDFSAENSSSSWTEDNVSVFRSDNCRVRRGLVSYNNSPTGDGVMIEGSFDCSVEDVDAVQQGNGAFAAVPQGPSGSGNCSFIRCRTRDSYDSGRDGRAKPTSGGLSFYVKISSGAPPHRLIDCAYDKVANPGNLVWKREALAPGWSLVHTSFVPRPPIKLVFDW